MNYSTHKSGTIVYIVSIFILFLPRGAAKDFFKTIHISTIPVISFSSTYIVCTNDNFKNIHVHKF